MSDVVEYNDKGLKDLIRALSGQVPMARVGILGSKDSRSGSASSNASVGVKHEFGGIVEAGNKTIKLPTRSFLRVPLMDNLQKYLEKSGAFDKETIRQVVREKSIKAWVAKIGLIGEQIVLDAFDTGGFGKWKPSNMKYKKNHQTLVETQQLRNSITSDVV